MGEDFKKMLRKWNLILIFVTLMMVGSLVSHSFGDEPRKLKWGLSVAGGFNAHQKPNLMMFAFLPRIGLALHKNWDLEFEGKFSYYGIQDDKNLYFLGVNSNLLFKPIQWKGGFFSSWEGWAWVIITAMERYMILGIRTLRDLFRQAGV